MVPDRVAPGAGLVPISSRTTPPRTACHDASVTLTWIPGESTSFALTAAGGGMVKSTWAAARLGLYAGDQLGSVLSPEAFVSRVSPDPSAFMT